MTDPTPDEPLNNGVFEERLAALSKRVDEGFASIAREQALREERYKSEAKALADALVLHDKVETEHFEILNGHRKEQLADRAEFARLKDVNQRADTQEAMTRSLVETLDKKIEARFVRSDEAILTLSNEIVKLGKENAGSTGRRVALTAAIAFAFSAVPLVLLLVSRSP